MLKLTMNAQVGDTISISQMYLATLKHPIGLVFFGTRFKTHGPGPSLLIRRLLL